MKEPLITQPTARPTRKVLAVILAGITAAIANYLLSQYLPGNNFTEVVENIDYLIQGGVMAIAGYFTRDRA